MRAKLQQLREASGYTQQTFSSAVGTSPSPGRWSVRRAVPSARCQTETLPGVW